MNFGKAGRALPFNKMETRISFLYASTCIFEANEPPRPPGEEEEEDPVVAERGPLLDPPFSPPVEVPDTTGAAATVCRKRV